MKNLFVCIAAVFLSSNIACGLKLTRPEDVKTTAILAGMAAYEIGYTVGELENAEIDSSSLRGRPHTLMRYSGPSWARATW